MRVAIYNATLYCRECGEGIAERLDAIDKENTGDSDDYPQFADSGPADSPHHCGGHEFYRNVPQGEGCPNAVNLEEWGTIDRLYGAETKTVGELLTDELTGEGIDYLREMLSEPDPTPYQRALHRFWEAAFADQL